MARIQEMRQQAEQERAARKQTIQVQLNKKGEKVRLLWRFNPELTEADRGTLEDQLESAKGGLLVKDLDAFRDLIMGMGYGGIIVKEAQGRSDPSVLPAKRSDEWIQLSSGAIKRKLKAKLEQEGQSTATASTLAEQRFDAFKDQLEPQQHGFLSFFPIAKRQQLTDFFEQYGIMVDYTFESGLAPPEPVAPKVKNTLTVEFINGKVFRFGKRKFENLCEKLSGCAIVSIDDLIRNLSGWQKGSYVYTTASQGRLVDVMNAAGIAVKIKETQKDKTPQKPKPRPVTFVRTSKGFRLKDKRLSNVSKQLGDTFAGFEADDFCCVPPNEEGSLRQFLDANGMELVIR